MQSKVITGIEHYRFEVSGGDEEKFFFVENTTTLTVNRLPACPPRIDLLLQHPWPGNFREVENVISTACITATGDFIDLSDVPEHLQHRPARLEGDEDW